MPLYLRSKIDLHLGFEHFKKNFVGAKMLL